MRVIPVLLLFLLSGIYLQAQEDINLVYRLSFPEPEKHLVEVELTYDSLEAGPETLVLPVWTPGYYKILDNPAHIIDFAVQGESGDSIIWNKTSKNEWTFENPVPQEVRITYNVYANRKSVAESNVSGEKAFLAGTDIFMFPKVSVEEAVMVDVELPVTWERISTGLERRDGRRFYAKDFNVLYDSPFYLGNQKVFSFREEDKDFTLSVATPEGLKAEAFIADLKKIIRSTTDLMKDIPFEHYSFLLLEEGRGGLEHWNSQAVFTGGDFTFESDKAYKDFMNFITHEYFHLYNAKAIRPIELGPFDYSKENYTTMLWVAEGFTVYFEYRIMRDAGLLSEQDFLDYMSSHIRTVETGEGKHHMSLERSSYDVWIYFLNRNEMTAETTISYYQKGPIIAMLMDLAIRHHTGNRKSLDDVMRHLYIKFYQELQRGYTEEEFWEVSEQIAGVSLEVIRTYVETTTAIDYQKYLRYGALGFRKQQGNEDQDYQLVKLAPENQLQEEIQKALLN